MAIYGSESKILKCQIHSCDPELVDGDTAMQLSSQLSVLTILTKMDGRDGRYPVLCLKDEGGKIIQLVPLTGSW